MNIYKRVSIYTHISADFALGEKLTYDYQLESVRKKELLR